MPAVAATVAELMPENLLIFGSTGSVGSALARRLRSAGQHVMLAGRDADKLERLGNEVDAPYCIVEAGDAAAFNKAVEQTSEEFGALDGVANCMGSILLKPAHLTTDEEWHETLTVNLTSSFAIVRAATNRMEEGGSIVLVSSAAAQIGIPNHEAIAAAKGGVIGLTRSAAASYASRKIRVNAVAPGLVKSNMTRRLWESETAASSSMQMHALGRLGEPEEVAAAIQWLLEPASSWVTGQVIGIDGGLGSVLPRARR